MIDASTPWWATPLVAGAFALLGVAIARSITILTLTASPVLIELAGRFHEPWSKFNRSAQGVEMTERMKYGHAGEAYELIQPFRNAVRAHLGLEPLPDGAPSNLAAQATY